VPAGNNVGIQQGLVLDNAGAPYNAILVARNNLGNAVTADFAAAQVIVGKQGTGTGALAKPALTEFGGNLSIAPGASISSLSVSSINGAAPGGALPANPSFSTIFASNATFSTIAMNDYLRLNNNLLDAGTNNTQGLFANSGDGSLYIFAPSTSVVRLGTQGYPNSVVVGSNDVKINAPTSVSSIVGLSSINGAAYPPSVNVNNSRVAMSTFGTGNVTSIPAGTVPFALSGAIPVNGGHTYRLSACLSFSNAGTGSFTSFAVDGGGAGYPIPLFTVVHPVTLTEDGRAGTYSGIFNLQAGGNIQVLATNTDPAIATAVQATQYQTPGQPPSWLLEDLGAIGA
jgi:hypothetical protein